MRIALIIEYDGTHYHGWQKQKQTGGTIQARVNEAVSRVANHPVEVICAGRTDKGVHATGQVVHFDTHAERSNYAWCVGVNSYLPPDIRVLEVQQVDADFHARYSAVARTYHYVLYHHQQRPALQRNFVSWCFRKLEAGLMHAAAQHLLGEHDFSAFRGMGCQSKTAIRKIEKIYVRSIGPHMILLEVKANAFLLHMVRNIVGTLIQVGSRLEDADWVKTVLENKDRKQAGITAPPQGLFLTEVHYPEKYTFENQNRLPWFLDLERGGCSGSNQI